MAANIKDLLPIGTVVLLKNASKPLMIYGIKQMGTEEGAKEYDYIGVLYPEGNIGVEFQYLFDHEDIQDILFKGYETPEREEFLQTIAKAYE